MIEFQGFLVVVDSSALIGTKFLLAVCRPVGVTAYGTGALPFFLLLLRFQFGKFFLGISNIDLADIVEINVNLSTIQIPT